MAETTQAIVYQESIRAIDEQLRALDGLRARTGTLLAAASIITAFLGSEALQSHQRLRLVQAQSRIESEFDWLTWLAIGAFVAVAFSCVLILWPWTWRFASSAKILIEDHVNAQEASSPGELHLFLARTIEGNWESNQRRLDGLSWCFRIASLSLALEVVLWVAALGTG